MHLRKIVTATATALVTLSTSANSQDSRFMSSAEFANIFVQDWILCYEPGVDGACEWAEYYPKSSNSRLTVLSYSPFLSNESAVSPSYGVAVSAADYALDGDLICDILDGSDNFQGFYYLDQGLHVLLDTRWFTPANPEFERSWREGRARVNYCFAFSVDRRDADNLPIELTQHYFIDGVQQDQTDRIVVFPADASDIRLKAPTRNSAGEPV